MRAAQARSEGFFVTAWTAGDETTESYTPDPKKGVQWICIVSIGSLSLSLDAQKNILYSSCIGMIRKDPYARICLDVNL